MAGEERQTGTGQEGPDTTGSVGWLLLVLAVLAAVASLLVFTTIPAGTLEKERAFLLYLAHGASAFLLVLVGTLSAYLGWRLFIGQLRAFSDLRILCLALAVLAGLTIASGEATRSALYAEGKLVAVAQSSAAIVEPLSEFKGSVGLFSLPLAIAAGFILWRYGERARQDPWLRSSVAVLLGLALFYTVVAFGLGPLRLGLALP